MATLGNLLARKGGTAVTGRTVRFRLLRIDAEHRTSIEEVIAVLFPVSADRELQVLASAAAACVHGLEHERKVQVAAHFLAESLRDPDKLHVRFVSAEDVHKFVACLTTDELERLHREYQAYMADEYAPATPADDKKAGDEALGFSTPGQAPPQS